MSSFNSDTYPESTYLFEHHPLPLWIIDAKTLGIKFANSASLKQYRFSQEEFLKMSFADLHVGEGKILLLHDLSAQSLSNHLFVYCTNKNETLFVKLFSSPIQYLGQDCLQITAVDLTDTFEKQRLLEEEKQRYEAYIGQSSEGIFCQEFAEPFPVTASDEEFIESSKSLYISYCNQAMAKMYGYNHAEEMLGLTTGQLIDYSDPSNINYLKSFFHNGFKVVDAESHEKNIYGESVYFINNAIGIIEDGFLKRIWGTQRNITDKKKIEQRFRFLAQLVEETSDVLNASDLNYKPITWNKAAENIYGITAEQAIGNELRKIIPDITYLNATRDEVRKSIDTYGEWRGEMYFTRPTDKKKVTLLIHYKAMKDEAGEVVGYISGAVDITKHKEAEQRIRESENRFKEVADSAPVMIWMANANRITTYTNKLWFDFTGVSVTDKEKEAWSALVHPEDVEEIEKIFDIAHSERKAVTTTYRLRRKDGAYCWVHDVSTPRFLEDGTFVGYIGSVVDINDQKEKEHQLRYQASLLENVTDIIVTTDMHFKVQTWNRVAEKYYGVPAKEAIGRPMKNLVDFLYKDTNTEQATADLFNHGIWENEVSFYTKDGSLKHVHYVVKFVYDEAGNKVGIISVGRDITDKKNAEAQLQESELFYRTLIDDSATATLLMDDTGAIRFISKAVENILGHRTEEVLGKNAFDFINPEDLGWALESFEKEKSDNPDFKSIVIRLKKKDGSWIWCMIRAHNMLDNPYVKSMVIHFHDDTLRKKASDALKESEKRFRSLIRDLQIGVFLTDETSTIIMCNAALAQMLSIPEEALLGMKVFDIMSDNMINEKSEPVPKEERPLTKAILHKKTVINSVIGVLHPVTKELSWIMVNADPILDDEGNIKHVICSVMNITERKRLEQELVSKQINHQKQLTQATIDGQEKERKEIGKELQDNIGQQLTTVKLFLDMAKSNEDSVTNEMLNMASKGVSDLINEIRAMSRSLVPPTLKDLGLIDSLQELISSINRVQSISITLEYNDFNEHETAENKKLMLYRIVQEQLNNIIKHAGADRAIIRLTSEPGTILLEITDNGKGFDMHAIRKGLGFTNIRNRAELFGGKVDVLSSLGNGCMLTVSIPQVVGQTV